MTSPQELHAWLTLTRAPGLGPVQIGQLLEAGFDPLELTTTPAPRLRERGLSQATCDALTEADRVGAQADLEWVQGTCDAHILTLSDPRYPSRLREIHGPPPVLFVRGDPTCLNDPQIALVGSRNPSPGGAELAHHFAAELSRCGLTVSSGLALGIDGAAHRGALQAGGTSVAVLGTGPDRCYPARHRELARDLAARGALVSEFAPGTGPRPEHFPRRNRILSGLSLGCLVVEAALRSGSLITARLAAEQGREVFAVPGSIHSPLARGTHALLRQGATLVEEVADVLREIAPQLLHEPSEALPSTQNEAPAGLTETERKVLDAMGFAPVSVDLLVERSGLTADRVSSILLTLELRGYAASSPGGRYCRVQKWGNDERERP